MNRTIFENVSKNFIETHQTKPLLVFSPGRINIIGEHTDYNQGFVFPAAINKGIYLAIAKAEKQSTITSLTLNESFNFSTSDELKPHKKNWINYILGVVDQIQKREIHLPNFSIIFDGDIPLGAGLSSSAALENAVIFGLNSLFNLNISKKEMILISQQAEHNFVGVECGIMDQYASMFGKENTAILLDCQSLNATEHKLNMQQYEWLLINTNVKHSLNDSEYNKRRKTCESVSKKLQKDTLRNVSISELKEQKHNLDIDSYNKALFVLEENDRVIKASKTLLNNDFSTLGKLLFKSHEGLSKLYNVSCTELDFLINEVKNISGVLGARMMGGGFGGCTINLIESEKKAAIISKITNNYKKQFNLNCSTYEVSIANGTQLFTF